MEYLSKPLAERDLLSEITRVSGIVGAPEEMAEAG